MERSQQNKHTKEEEEEEEEGVNSVSVLPDVSAALDAAATTLGEELSST